MSVCQCMLPLLAAFQHGSRSCQRTTHWMVTLPHTNVLHLCLIVFPPAVLPIHSVPDLFFCQRCQTFSIHLQKKRTNKQKKKNPPNLQSFNSMPCLPHPPRCWGLVCAATLFLTSMSLSNEFRSKNKFRRTFIHQFIHYISIHPFTHPPMHLSIFRLLTGELTDLIQISVFREQRLWNKSIWDIYFNVKSDVSGLLAFFIFTGGFIACTKCFIGLKVALHWKHSPSIQISFA